MAKAKTLAQQAAEIAQQQIGPQETAVKRAIADAEAKRLAAATATRGIIGAAGELSAGDAAALRDAYAQAADRVSGLSQGLTGATRTAMEQAAAAGGERLHALGLPPIGVTSVAGPAAQTAHYVGGVLPAGTLAQTAPLVMQNAQIGRAALGARLADQASLADYEAQQGVKTLRDKIADIEATRPGLVTKARSALVEEQQKADAARLNEKIKLGQLDLAQAKASWDMASDLTNSTGYVYGIDRSGRPYNTGVRAPGSAAGRAATAAETADLNRAAMGQRSQASIAAQNERARLARQTQLKIARDNRVAKAKGAAGRAPTPGEKATLLKGANAQGASALDKYITGVWSRVPGSQSQGPEESDEAYAARIGPAKAELQRRLRANWRPLLSTVEGQVAPFLSTYGYTPRQIQDYVYRLVRARVPAVDIGFRAANLG